MTTIATVPPGPRVRPDLAAVPRYVPGRPAAAPATGGPASGAAWKISSNENPYPPLPSVLEAVARAAASANRYPDITSARLTAALAEHHDMPADRIVVGCGSVSLLGQVAEAVVAPGDEVVYAWRSFESYPIVTGVAGGTAVPVPLTADGRHDLDAMAAAVTRRTRLVFICTPNNPTGPAVHRGELERFLDRVPPDVLVVLDEAYREFVREPDVPDGVALHREHPNVASFRTFSKAYGLAGLRVGYAVAHPDIADALRATASPFAVSTIAQEAALASLEAEAELADRVDALVAERARVVSVLADQGWSVPDAQGNFVWLPLGAGAVPFAEHCLRHGLSVRPFAGDGVRCTIAEPDANDRFLEMTRSWRDLG